MVKNKVHTSLENEHHDQCVDIFERLHGSFGYEEFLRTPRARHELRGTQ